MGGHSDAAAHNSKAVLSVFIQFKIKNQEDKTHSRDTAKDHFTCIYWVIYTLIGQNFDCRENSNVI